MSNISAWVFQRPEQVRDLGEDNASWYVGWYEPGAHAGKSPSVLASGAITRRRSTAARSKDS
jgi:hypothetical protein